MLVFTKKKNVSAFTGSQTCSERLVVIWQTFDFRMEKRTVRRISL